MSKKLFLLLCLCVFVVLADAAPKKSAKKSSSKKKTKKTEVVVVEEKKVEDDGDYISAPDDPLDASYSETGDETKKFDVETDRSDFSDAQMEERLSRKKFEDEQRLDEYANSLRRRDWLKNRLILELGLGSRMSFMGKNGMGMGFGAEYITRWHAAAYASFGFLPGGEDNVFPDDLELEGGFSYKLGLNYYILPKNPLHIGVSVSYGTVYFDHDIRPNKDKMRPLISVDGFQFDVLINYLTSEWYYLQFSVGMYYASKYASKDLSNPSFDVTSKTDNTPVSIVVDPDGIPKYGIVFGITIGYAFPEFFPDDTEKRRRERERERIESNVNYSRD